MPLSTACPKPETRYTRKVEKMKTLAAHEREVWAAVDARDQSTCRVCGTFCAPRTTSMLRKAHRHHLKYRSAGGPTETWNLVTICAGCHNEEHEHRLRLIGNADERDPHGRLAGVKVERLRESGWAIEKFC